MVYTPAPLPGYKASIQITSQPSVPLTNEAMTTPDSTVYTIADPADRYWDPTVAPVVQTGLPEVETVSITGSPTGGSFTLTFSGQTTAAIAYNATAANVASALNALSNINAGGVTATGGPLPATAVVVTFAATLAPGPQAVFTHTDSLTGGSSPAAHVTETQHGVAYATVAASTYSIQWLGGIVTFNTIVAGVSPMAQMLSVNSYPYSYLGQADTADLTFDMEMADITSLSTTGTPIAFKSYLAMMQGFAIKLHRYYLDATFFSSFLVLSPVVQVAVQVYIGHDATERFEGFCWLKVEDVKLAVNKPVEESLDLQGTGVFAYYS